ncbi:MAG: methyltransferase domain-containing protein [Dehalococcoidia bacterium]
MSEQTPREWQLVGNLAENYERYLVPAIFRPWAIGLVDLAAPQQGERLLDIACGTGVVARIASERLGPAAKVTGLDLNPGMLAVAGSVTPAGASIEWQQGNAEGMPLPDEGFDVVLCQQGLQFFPNKATALREMNRVLAPGGRLALSAWRDIKHIPGYLALAETLTQYVSPESGGFLQMLGSLDDPAELRNLIEEAGFTDVTIRVESGELRFSSPEAFVWEIVQCTPLVWMTPVTQADESTRTNLVNDVASRLQEYVHDDRSLAFPIEATVVTAKKEVKR